MAMHFLGPERWYNNFDEFLDQIANAACHQRMSALLPFLYMRNLRNLSKNYLICVCVAGLRDRLNYNTQRHLADRANVSVVG